MVIFDLIQQGLNAGGGSWTDFSIDFLWGGYDGWALACDAVNGHSGCPGSSFTAIGAAFATEGYFVQSDVIWALTHSSFGMWAPLLYMVAAMGGIVSLALGAPPKMYLWFFMGPAIYSWLIGTTEPALGVQWRVAGVPQEQTEVWKLAEIGLKNTSIVQRRGDIKISRDAAPSSPVDVSLFFLWFDELISGTVQQLVAWTGVFSQYGSDTGVASPSGQTNLISLSGGTGSSPGGSTGGTCDNIRGDDNTSSGPDRWYLLSQLKWTYLDNITSARLRSGELRDIFTTFLSSECGEKLNDVIDDTALVAAANSRTGRLPCTVFKQKATTSSSSTTTTTTTGGSTHESDLAATCTSDITQANNDYQSISNVLGVTVPVANSVRSLWKENSACGSFRTFFEGNSAGSSKLSSVSTSVTGELGAYDDVYCNDLLFYIIQGFRWEAGHIYYQLVSSAPAGMTADEMLFNLFYGWDFGPSITSTTELRDYAKNLILIHLFRNELAIAPSKLDRRYLSSSQQTEKNSETYLANTGAKSKYAEVYTWAMMVPYIQGVLLYLFAMGYPIACVVIVVPGWHKTLFTWMSFWAWLKLWDIGFAIVVVLERSIWAMLMGNNDTMARINRMVAPMKDAGQVCVSTCGSASTSSTTDGAAWVQMPNVYDGGTGGSSTASDLMTNALAIFDRSLLLGSAINFDVQNGYYIYIMSAMYFAIPAVTGQLVLGAKAGVAQMVGGMASGVGGDAARGASGGFTSEMQKMAAANNATMGQEAYAKNMRENGLAARAIQAGNRGMENQLRSGLFGAQSGVLDREMQQMDRDKNMSMQGLNAAVAGERYKNIWGKATMGQVTGSVQALGSTGTSISMAQRAAPGGAEPGGSPSTLGIGSAGLNGAGSLAQALGGGYFDKEMAEIDAKNAIAQYGIEKGFNPKMAQGTALQAAYGMEQAKLGADQNRLGMAERRTMAQADFGAQMAAWQAKRDFANSGTAGYLGAMGVDTSFMTPGPKPTDATGMATWGMLGSDVAKEANAASDGDAYDNWIKGSYGNLFNSKSYQEGNAANGVGASGVVGLYNPVSMKGMNDYVFGDGVKGSPNQKGIDVNGGFGVVGLEATNAASRVASGISKDSSPQEIKQAQGRAINAAQNVVDEATTGYNRTWGGAIDSARSLDDLKSR